MSRSPILFVVALLFLAAAISAGTTLYDSAKLSQSVPAATQTPAAEEHLTSTRPSKEIPTEPSGVSPSLSGEAEHSKSPAGHDLGNEQAALPPPVKAPAVSAPVDSPSLGSAESQIVSLPRVVVPLPIERPSAETIREQNALAAPLFSEVKWPSGGAPRPVGFYSAGCLAGAEQLALQGPHWQVMRPSRNRYWGHPNLLNFIARLAENVSKRSDWLGILVGDMSQPRGGPLPSGHASHQIGLDADIWLHPMPAKPYTRTEADTLPMLSVVASDHKTLDPNFWQASDAAMIKIAAQDPDVERVFVNAAIKIELCRLKTTNDETWMAKVRPWYGHDDHMHVRLKCPADASQCRDQEPTPEGDGCGKSLDQWFSKGHLAIEQRLKTQAPSERHVLMRDLPIACTAVLHEPAQSHFATSAH